MSSHSGSPTPGFEEYSRSGCTGPVLSLLALGVLGTGVAYVVVTIAAGRLGSTRASSTAFLIPPVALLLGIVVRHEHVAALSILDAAVCVAGAWLMNRARS